MLIDKIIDYEQGTLSEKETLELFSELVRTGQAWTLQGHYGRTAKALIDNGFLDGDGEILIDLESALEEGGF